MIIHKLISHHLRNKDDPYFYLLQAQDAIRWIEQSGVALGPETRALDLGCGHGVFGAELGKRGCKAEFADEVNMLLPEVANHPYHRVNIDCDDLAALGQYDLVICSNVFEHLSKPNQFLDSIHRILTPRGKLYLSWTNWFSPWGGHEWSPFHYFGALRGQRLYDRFVGRKRNHTVYENLFPTYIGQTFKVIRNSPTLKVYRAAPRYYTELGFLIKVPIVREFLTWNCAVLLGRK